MSDVTVLKFQHLHDTRKYIFWKLYLPMKYVSCQPKSIGDTLLFKIFSGNTGAGQCSLLLFPSLGKL